MNKKFNAFLWIGLLGALTVGTGFITDIWRVSRGDTGIWWTHKDRGLSLEETKNNFEVYICGKRLQEHLSEEALLVAGNNGEQHRIVAGDISVRMNNWEKTRTSVLAKTSISGFVFGIAIALLLIGLFQAFTRKQKPCCQDTGTKPL